MCGPRNHLQSDTKPSFQRLTLIQPDVRDNLRILERITTLTPELQRANHWSDQNTRTMKKCQTSVQKCRKRPESPANIMFGHFWAFLFVYLVAALFTTPEFLTEISWFAWFSSSGRVTVVFTPRPYGAPIVLTMSTPNFDHDFRRFGKFL